MWLHVFVIATIFLLVILWVYTGINKLSLITIKETAEAIKSYLRYIEFCTKDHTGIRESIKIYFHCLIHFHQSVTADTLHGKVHFCLTCWMGQREEIHRQVKSQGG